MKKAIIVYMTVALLLTGCGAGGKSEVVENKAVADIKDGETVTFPRQTPYRQYNAVDEGKNTEARNESAESRAKRISVRLSKIESLDEATVVITGNTAIVGLEFAGIPDEGLVMKIKRQVEKEVRAEDDSIDHIAVTAAPDLVKRINNMFRRSHI